AADYIDGCPFVLLAGDALADWEVALATFLTHSNPTLAPFPTLASALRIATKYEIPPLRRWAATALAARWPSDVLSMCLDSDSASAPSDAAHAIPLFRACRLEPLLPAAFYALSLQSFVPSPRSSTAYAPPSPHRILDPADMQRLLAGREALHDSLVRMLVDPLARFDSEFDFSSFDSSNSYEPREDRRCACAPRLEAYWRARLVPSSSASSRSLAAVQEPRTCLLRALAGMLHDEAFVGTLCGASTLSPACPTSRGHGGEENQDATMSGAAPPSPYTHAYGSAHEDAYARGEFVSGREDRLSIALYANASGCTETHLRLVRWRLARLRDGIQGVGAGEGE
ncbi:hypothetical protein B0H11DRAFT_1994550, partial [Mycena galericulata]